jgi:hypothetical protein
MHAFTELVLANGITGKGHRFIIDFVIVKAGFERNVLNPLAPFFNLFLFAIL